MNGWPVVRLADRCDVITKGTTPTTLGYAFSDSGIPFIRVENVGDVNVRINRDILFIDEPTHRALSRSHVRSGDVLVSIAGTIGRVSIVQDGAPPLNCNQAVAIVRASPEFHRPYLRHWLRSRGAQDQMRGVAVTGTISNLSLAQLGSLKVPFPPLAEQRRIAEILDKADALRAKRRAALAQLDTLTQSIFLDMFGDPATNRNGWTKVTLGEVATFVGGGTPSRSKPEFFTGSISWATSKDMQSEFLDDTEEHITEEAIKNSATKLVPAGTILIVVKSKVLARRLPVAISRVATCFGQDLKGVQVGPRCEVSFVAASLRIGSQLLLNRARGINTEGLTLEHLMSFPLTLPPLKLQREFARRIATVLDLKTKATVSLNKLECAFASLQHRAFRGEL